MSKKPYRIVDLGQKVQRYDLSRLPKKKRKSSSFVRRKEGEGLQAQGCVVGLSTDCEDELPTITFREGISTGHVLVHEADALEAYKLELVTGKGFVVLDRFLTTAAVQDFDPNEGSILKVLYVHCTSCIYTSFNICTCTNSKYISL